MQEKTLIIAYGNRDREDDGAGWHILDKLALQLGLETPEFPGDQVSTPNGRLTLLYLFQLLPEMAEDIADYDQLIFIDAHNSPSLPNLVFEQVSPDQTHSAFTHHMGPGELLAIAQILGRKLPLSWILSVRGFSFRFARTLSEETSEMVDQAFSRLLTHLSLTV
ncbi:MAG: hydrogenase maturation protease [Anaerolineaceae bacterium]